jgi:hypothetical protein
MDDVVKTADGLPAWWPRAPRWPADSSVLDSSVVLPPHLLRLARMGTGHQRLLDGQHAHLTMLLGRAAKDERMTARQWYVDFAKFAGFELDMDQFPDGADALMTSNDFMHRLYDAQPGRAATYSLPALLVRKCDRCHK